jgi:hypothetical protein
VNRERESNANLRCAAGWKNFLSHVY